MLTRISRNANSIVVRDSRSKQLIRLGQENGVQPRSDFRSTCSACGQTLLRETPGVGSEPGNDDIPQQPEFIDTNYFRMLAQSLPGSAQTSPPPSPRRRLVQPVRQPVAVTAERLPDDAEFIASAPAPPSEAHGISETAFSPKYFERFFVVEKELGRGGRGVVLLVKHLLQGVSIGEFACKRVPIGDDHRWLEKVLVEVQLLQTLSHQNLVSYRHVWLEDFKLNAFGPSVPCAFILQQYCNGGDLHNFLCGPLQATATTEELKERIRRRSKGEHELPRKIAEPVRLHFEQIYSFFRDITAGLRHLHGQKFVHRDLKPSNCLLHTDGNGTRVLVSDFGEVQYESATRQSTGATGTISYCAPEVLQRLSPDGPFGNFTFKSDIFSLGMILHFLCFAHLPYRSADVVHEEREDVNELRREITAWQGFDDHQKIRPELPDQLYEFLKRLLSLDPDLRPTADEVSHGIRAGGLEDPIEPYRRRNSFSPEELTPGHRVQPVDSSMRDLSPTKRNERSQAGPSSYTRSQTSYVRRRNVQGGHQDITIETHRSRAHNHSTGSPTSPTLHQDVILRPKVSSPIPSPRQSQSPEPELNPHQHRPPLLLPPPPSRSAAFTARFRMILLADLSSSTIRVSIFSAKLLSVLQPCIWNTASINPFVAYPLIVLAIFETITHDYKFWHLLFGLVPHLVVLSWALRNGSLCVNAKSDGVWNAP